MRWIFISPHLDDAVLSAGGLIYDLSRAGQRVENWTLTAGFPSDENLSPLAQILHMQWGFTSAAQTIRARRLEDENASAIVGAIPIHFDFLDCIYRRGADGNHLYTQEVFVPPHADEADLPARIAAALAPRLGADDVLVCPLTVGRHVDHLHVRRAVEMLNRPLLYYADVPYVLDKPEELIPLVNGAQAEVRQVSSAGIPAWQQGVAAYASQISNLFASPEIMQERIKIYASRGVRLWKFA